MTPVDLLYAPILLDETFIKAWDTDAEKSFISEEVYSTYFSYRPIKMSNAEVVIAQGAKCTNLGTVELQIRINEFTKTGNFHALGEMQYLCILGIDFLQVVTLDLGLVISKERIRTAKANIKAITEMIPPKNVRQAAKFLGMTECYRKFIKSYANLCKPLYMLKRENVKFVWSEEGPTAFDGLKKAVTGVLVLKLPDFNSPFELFTGGGGGCGSTVVKIHAIIGEVEIGDVTIYRPFRESRQAKSYCHLYGAQGQRQAYF
ncbi:hypothetical protein TNCV_1946891 [Trichonephila clavipes]|nr:hypothetical protein TNCV_1946891 [Trichonephila clavipes]